jgi:Na+/H+-dicarboxylate symporter
LVCRLPKIQKFRSLEDKRNINLAVKKDGIQKLFKNITSIERKETIATYIKPIGSIFIRLLSFLAIPLVLASLIVGASSLGDIKRLGRIGLKTFSLYIITTAIAISIGLILANLIKPGSRIEPEAKDKLLGSYSGTVQFNADNAQIDIIDFFVEIVPANPFKAIANGEMLQIVFFAVFFGVALTFVKKQFYDPVVNFFNGVSETMIKMVDIVMLIAPFGVFALISSTVAEFGFDILYTLVWYMLCVILGLVLQIAVVYSSLVSALGKMSPFFFLKGMKTAMTIAFSSSSSAATLPVTMEAAEQNLKIPKHITGFVLPLGATINMDGTALYQGVASIFIAQVYGIELGIAEQLTIIFTATLASIGTAPVPGVGIIMLIMILQSVHVPAEGIALILGVDRILDMSRTIVNITGDAAVAAAVWGTEKKEALPEPAEAI